jgi:hypothetical protein
MAADPRLTNEAASSACNAVVDMIDGGGGAGNIIFYNGTIPTNADTAIGAHTALSTAVFNATAFGAASNGTATANAITGSTAGVAGTATWARWYQNDGGTVLDCTVGTSGEDINFNSNIFTVGASVSVTALTVTVPKT